MRNLKVLGLAFVAMLALSATSASVASADVFAADSYNTTLTGAKDGTFVDQFVTTAGTVTCTEPTYHATITGPTSSVQATPDYISDGKCTTSGIPTTISMNGCSYTFTVAGGGATTGGAILDCPGGNQVTVTVAASGSSTHKCTLHIGAQNVGGTVTYTNIANGDVTVEANLKEIHYTHTAGSGLGACGTGTGNTGTLTAKAVVSGETDPGGVAVNIFMN